MFLTVWVVGSSLTSCIIFYFYYEYNQTIQYFKNLDLTPFIRINLSDIIHAHIDMAQAEETLTIFLQTMSKYFSKSYVEEWLFEIMHFDDISTQQYLCFYEIFYQKIRKFSDKIQLGIFSVNQTSKSLLERFRSELLFCHKKKYIPDFITFKVEPNIKKDDSLGLQIESHKQLKDHHTDMIEKIQQIIAGCGLTKIPLYAIEWNTLAGQNIFDVGSFYRSALIFKAMLDMSENKNINGLAFWLNDQSRERIIGVNYATLSLFHCAMAKRAAFYTLQAFTRLGTELLYRNEHVFIGKNQQGDYVILVSNPCYFNPSHSLDSNFVLDYQKKFSIEIGQIKPGAYQFKVYHFKMNYSFAINSTEESHKISDLPAFKYNDEDMLEHIEHIAAPEFSVFEQSIQEKLNLNLSLSFNAATLYIIRYLK